MRKKWLYAIAILITWWIRGLDHLIAQPSRENKSDLVNDRQSPPLIVRKCNDFNLTGKGTADEWNNAEWHVMKKLDPGGKNYESKFRILYSEKGIYVNFNGEDGKITTRFDEDFQDLFQGDVFEVFFHPDPQTPLYLEYEINQLNKELVLLVPHLKNRVFGWIPWHYENQRRITKAVQVEKGKMEINSSISSWSAELFFPYAIFNPLQNSPPKSGTVWNANFTGSITTAGR